MILYHGSTVQIKCPEIIKNDIGRDFGFAFYTTTIKEQAERWAKRRLRINSKENIESSAIVNVYEWDESIPLNIKKFTSADEEWLDMVVRCRSDISYAHNYDIVIGKIADDNVGETVDFVLAGIMRKEDAIERLKFQKINDQIAFCSEISLKSLFFKSSYIVEV